MEYEQSGHEGQLSEQEINTMSRRVDEINQEIGRLELGRSYLSDPVDTKRIDEINQRIPRLVDERTDLFRHGAE
jgi:hypothetical protein